MSNFLKKLRSKNIFSLVAMDLSCGVIEYAVISYLFGEGFDYKILGLAVFFAFLPDLDFIPFVFLRKRLNLMSHQMIHYPLILLPFGFVLVLLAGGEYIATLYLVGVAVHFINDTTDNLGGIKWLWPFINAYFSFKNGKIIRAERQREEFYSIIKNGMEDRNIVQDLFKRTKVENKDLKHKPVILYVLAAVFLLIFLVK